MTDNKSNGLDCNSIETDGSPRITLTRAIAPGRQLSNFSSASSELLMSIPFTSTMISFFLNPQAAEGEFGATLVTKAPWTSGYL
jgi:hypothetical protein